jgi:hypothetical protein
MLRGKTPPWVVLCLPTLIAVLSAFTLSAVGQWVASYGNPATETSIPTVTGYLAAILLYSAGSIVRRNWRHILIMALVGLAISVLHLTHVLTIGPFARWPIGVAVSATDVFIIVSLELTLSGHRSLMSYVWAMPICIATGGLMAVASAWTSLVEWNLNVPVRPPSVTSLPLEYIAMKTFDAALIWLSVMSLNARPVRTWGWLARAVALVAVTVAMGATVAFFTVGLQAASRSSVLRGSPFPMSTGADILAQVGDDSDCEFLWDRIEKSDWTKVAKDIGRSGYPFPDWRESAIPALSKRDPADAAKRLSRMLQDRPTKYLAAMSAPYLAKVNRLDAVPILFRYALFDGDDKLTDALDNMGIREVAYVYISQWGELRAIAANEDFVLSLYGSATYCKELQERHHRNLVKLLGTDRGEDPVAWGKYWDSAAANWPSPLSPSQRAEVDRVVTCYVRYAIATGEYERVRKWRAYQTAIADLQNAGLHDDAARLERTLDRIVTRPPENLVAELFQAILRAGPKAKEFFKSANRSLAIKPPNWNIPGIDALEKEVTAYSERVAAATSDSSQKVDSKSQNVVKPKAKR